MERKGLIHVYTGEGKGKTTSAVGLCVRALGHNKKVCYVYFHKNPEKYGYTEINNLGKLGAKIYGFAKGHPFCDKEMKKNELKRQVEEGLKTIKQIINKELFDLVILDEILISVRDGFISEKLLVEFIKNKPENLELVLTGRGATENICKIADYVSHITKIKHPYDKKIKSREGIEY